MTWAMVGVLYVAFVGILRAAVPRAQTLKGALGFSKLVVDAKYPSSLVIDLATQAEATPRVAGSPLSASLSGGLADTS